MPEGIKGQEPEREYILYFYDGSIRRVFGKRSQFQELPVSRIEEVPVGRYVTSNFLRDMERINKVIGEGFVSLQDVIDPQALLDRITALHPDEAPFNVKEVIDEIFKLSRKLWEFRPPPPDSLFRRD
ncbi:hypothetical protein ES703_79470 [subsurface metagenome]